MPRTSQFAAVLALFSATPGVVAVVPRAFPPLNESTLRAIYADVAKGFNLPYPTPGSYGIYCNPCADGDSIGGLVRLPFHDSMGGGRPDGKGGPNGCIDWTTGDNNGLQVRELYTAYVSVCMCPARHKAVTILHTLCL